ncbi:MAG: hypothetical protein WD448_05470 [Woeseia sp.]
MKVREHFIVRLGGNDYLDTPNLIVCSGEPILKLTRDEVSDELKVEAEIFDATGNRTAVVRGTELVDGDPGTIEIRSTESSYVIRDKTADRTVCEIRRRAGKQKEDLDVSVLMRTPDGFLIHANPLQSNVGLPRHEEPVCGDAAIMLP